MLIKQKIVKIGYVAPTYFMMYRCDKCGTEFPEINGNIMCNGHKITKCPWCRKNIQSAFITHTKISYKPKTTDYYDDSQYSKLEINTVEKYRKNKKIKKECESN